MAPHALVAATVLLALFSAGFADVYMHNPRGSNNRLNEQSANRDNADRMFDSQNNNRGGYNKGDLTDQAFQTYFQQYDMIHYMSDINWKTNGQKSILGVEWTNQHGCGGNELGDPHKVNCELIIQYSCASEQFTFDQTRDDCTQECFVPQSGNPTCDPNGSPPCPTVEMNSGNCTAAGFRFQAAQYYDQYNCAHRCISNTDGSDITNAYSAAACSASGGSWLQHTQNGPYIRMRDGLNTNTQDYTDPTTAADLTSQGEFNRKVNNDHYDRGLHESWEVYDDCYRRERNGGLFTADQNLQNNQLGYEAAVVTRQQPNENRRGYECQEERDYYPYWHPSQWRDIVIMTDRLDLCTFYQTESQNVKGKNRCFNTAACSNCIRYNNAVDCANNGGAWKTVPPFYIDPPECIQAPWSRVNHLGNGRHGQPNSYNWTLPYIDQGNSVQRCVLRLRYNISTDDYDGWRVNASFNDNPGRGIESPVKQNPSVDIGASNQALRLAINTAQFGRTFQDRSHVFRLIPRPAVSATPPSRASTLASSPAAAANFFSGCQTLYNLNVRGKRGNIVQTFPAVEYDFYPNQLHVTTDDCVHVQWTGSNTHNNGNPAGDGQAGDAGEGREGTDRHNWVELGSTFAESFPLPQEDHTMMSSITDAFDPAGAYDALDLECECAQCSGMTGAALTTCYHGCWTRAKQNWALRMTTVGYYGTFNCTYDANRLTNTGRTQLNNLLDNAYASFPGGIFKFSKGTFHYMCTRNNNFSNRDQKGKLLVA